MQRNRNTWLAAGLAVIFMTVGTGCEDPKARIAILEDENRALAMDLEQARAQMDRAQRDNEACQSSLMAAQRQNSDLRTQLASKPTAAPAAAAPVMDMPGNWQPVPGGAMVAIDGSVLFDSGKAALKQSSQKLLNQLASEIRSSFGDKDIYVFGHTDTDPIKKSGWKDNRELSAQRSLAVVRYLAEQGLPQSHLVACAWGEHRPVASNANKDGKSKNRRVEFFAVDPTIAMAPR